MTQAEVQEWSDAPEQYYLLQDSLDSTESIRVRDGLDVTRLVFCVISTREGEELYHQTGDVPTGAAFHNMKIFIMGI